jgi:hypothetical protein
MRRVSEELTREIHIVPKGCTFKMHLDIKSKVVPVLKYIIKHYAKKTYGREKV